MKKLFFLLTFLVLTINAQTTYYVSSIRGSDANNGTSISTQWKSISKVNSMIFQPGDKILFERGSIWFETLIPRSSGTEENPITYSSYGSGKRPIISGSNPITNWALHSTNIYKANVTQLPKALFFELSDTVHWGIEKESLSELTNERDYFLDKPNNVIYAYANENTVWQYQEVYGSVRNWGIYSHYPDISHYTIFENFELKYSMEGGIRTIDDNYVIFRNIKSHHHGYIDESDGQGIQVQGKHCKILNNFLYENGQHGLYVSFYSGTNSIVEDILIEGNTVWNNYHTGIDIMNDGGLTNGLKNLIIRNNTVYDSPDRNTQPRDIAIQLVSYEPGTIEDVLICYNKVYNSNGISYNINARSNNIKVYNNLSFGANSYGFVFQTDGIVDVKNNLCSKSIGSSAVALSNTNNIKMDYNIWHGGKWGLILRGNQYYNTQSEFYTATGLDEHSYFQMAEFKDTTNLDFRLKANSIGINSGINVGLNEDFDYNRMFGNPDIGIYEQQSQKIEVKLACKVILEGALYREHSYNDTMRTLLYNNQLLPLSQPYNQAPWNYSGSEELSSIPTIPIVDWVLVELRNTSSNVKSRRAGLIRYDGYISDLEGNKPLKFSLDNKASFYITIRHRNHLDIMSKNKREFLPDRTVWYDFTQSSSAYYGDSLGTKKIDSKWVMVAGDLNQTDTIDIVDTQLIWTSERDPIRNQYSLLDATLDGNANDYDINLTNQYNKGRISTVPKLVGLNARTIQTITNSKGLNECINKNKLNRNSANISLSNYPNPFNPSTIISFNIANDNSLVKLNIFNSIGQLVETLVDKNLSKGNYNAVFDGSKLSSGVYIYTLQVNNKVLSKKLLLLK